MRHRGNSQHLHYGLR